MFCDLTSARIAHPAIVISAIRSIRSHRFDSEERRSAFWENDIPLLRAKQYQLRREVKMLFKQIERPEDPSNIFQIEKRLGKKLIQWREINLVLEESRYLDQDFQQIDAVLQKNPPLGEEDLELLCRVEKISSYVRRMDLNTAARP